MKKQEPAASFGRFFRKKRIELGLTLRSFCERFGYDPGNISKIERDRLLPSLEPDKLNGYAKALQIEEGTPDWVTFFDLAHTSKGKIPSDLSSNKYLPLLFRSIRGKRISRNKLEKIIELINES